MNNLISVKRRFKGILDQALTFPGLGMSPWMKGIHLSPPMNPLEYPYGASAIFCVSVDFDVTQIDRQRANREGTRQLLDLSEKYGISMTWAICGRTAEEDPESYHSILESKQPQEIGVHTYSHIDVSSCGVSEFEDEIEKCLKVLQLAKSPKSFVFPYNRLGKFDVLKKMGFVAFRAKNRMIGPPKLEHGLWNISPTYHADRKTFNSLPFVKKLVDTAVSNNSVFHFWLHPWDMIPETSSQQSLAKELVEPLFRYACQRRDARSSALAFCPMGDLAQHFETALSGSQSRK